MPLGWNEIHQLEMEESYPAAIEAIEARLRADPADVEAVIRLGFNLWYAAHGMDRMQKVLPKEAYATRFMELLGAYRQRLADNADFCWAFGLGISLFWFEFPGADEATGEALLAQARLLDPFYRHLFSMGQEKIAERFRGRGIFAAYYAVADA